MTTLNDVQFREQFACQLGGVQTAYSVTIKNSWAVEVAFNYQHNPYRMVLTGGNSATNKLHRLFLAEIPTPNPAEFGAIDDRDNLNVTSLQRQAFCVRLAQNAMECLNETLIQQGRNVLDYAVWYREQPRPDTFANIVQKQVCHFIVHEDFISGTVQFTETAWRPNV